MTSQEYEALLAIRLNIERAKSLLIHSPVERAHWLTFYAATRCLEIVSEASRRLSSDIMGRHADVPWTLIRAAGNIYRHEYHIVAEDRVWDSIEHELATLELAVAKELAGQAP